MSRIKEHFHEEICQMSEDFLDDEYQVAEFEAEQEMIEKFEDEKEAIQKSDMPNFFHS